MSSIARDLARWEAGELTLAELELTHPVAEIDELIALDARLTMASTEVAVADVGEWDRIAATLPDRRLPLLERVKLRLQRPLAVALVGTVVSTSAAVAAVPPVREAATSAVTEVRRLLFGEEPSSLQDGTLEAPKKDGSTQPVEPSSGPARKAGATDVEVSDDSAGRRREIPAGSKGSSKPASGGSSEQTSSSSSVPVSSSEGASSGSFDGSSDSSDTSDDEDSRDASSDSSEDSSEDGTDRSADESSDSWEDGDGSGSSEDSSEDCSSESDECWDGTFPDPDDV